MGKNTRGWPFQVSCSGPVQIKGKSCAVIVITDGLCVVMIYSRILKLLVKQWTVVCCFNYIKLAYWCFLHLWIKEIPVFNLPLANHFHASFQVEWVVKNSDWRPHLSFERYNSNYMTVNNFCKLMKLARLSSYWTVFWLFTVIIRQ